jgi:RNA polymerase sigma-70 factor (ECF subfamily)
MSVEGAVGPEVSESLAEPEFRDVSSPATGVAADWETAYRENVAWVYRLAFGRLGNRDDAEDVTAEVFTRALPRLRLTVPLEQVRAYLAATARSVLADYWRRSYGLDLPVPLDLDIADASATSTSQQDSVNRANQLLGRLSERYRRVLELRFLNGCSIAETARALDISVGSVKVLQHRALRRAAQLGRAELDG